MRENPLLFPISFSAQLLTLPNLQRNLLFTTFLKTVLLSQLVESCIIIRNSPTVRDAISLFHTYIAFHNFYAKKPPPYDKFNCLLEWLVLDLRSQILDLLSNLGFCGILTFLPEDTTFNAIERVLCSLSGPNLAIYSNSSNSSKLPTPPSTGDSLGPNPPNDNGSPSPPNNHPSSPPFNVWNSTFWNLSTLAARITGALMESWTPTQQSSTSPIPTPVLQPVSCTLYHCPHTWFLSCYQCGSQTHFKTNCPNYICPSCNMATPGHNCRCCPSELPESDHCNSLNNDTFWFSELVLWGGWCCGIH